MAVNTTYIDAFKGYITDVPEMWFKRCDGRIFHFDELTQATVSPSVEYNEVNAGWSLFPVAYLPGQSTMEMSITSGQFSAELFSMANAVNFKDQSDYTGFVTEYLPVGGTAAAPSVTLTYDVAENGKIYIPSLFDGDGSGATATGKVVDLTSAADLLADKLGKTIEVTYDAVIGDAHITEIDNRSSAIGEALFRWPVYSAGEDCTDSAIKGYVYMKVYRCRVTAAPGFDTSYKSAATNEITLGAMDAKRTDGAIYHIAYVENAQGE